MQAKIASVTSLSGIKIGNAQDINAATGCTVVLCPDGGTVGVDVRGGSPGTRETDLLKAENYVDKVHAVMLSGGSAFGLDAAGGVMDYLEKKGIGFDVGVTKVPIVTGAVLFDLTCGDFSVRPDKNMGFEACLAAERGDFAEGSLGAGTGATIGKFFGSAHAMKGGLGSYCINIGELMIGAVVAVNCLGDVIDPKGGQILAGAYQNETFTFLNSEQAMAAKYQKPANLFAGNTTIGVVLTNATLSKAQANKVSSMAHDGYARTMRPAHTLFDGDTIFTVATGQMEADINAVGILAAQVMEEAVLAAIKKAASLQGYLSYQDVQRKIMTK